MTELFAAYCANRDAIACGVKSQDGVGEPMGPMDFAGVIKWDPVWGNQTLQIYGSFEGFPGYNNALFGLVIY